MYKGRNSRDFVETQIEFASYIRNPELNDEPDGIESRRLRIYAELFFNNVKNFLSTTFPIAKACLGEADWQALCREFFHRHPSESPYFAEISQEFLTFLSERCAPTDRVDRTTVSSEKLAGVKLNEERLLPDYLLELCHYEWVELSLDLAVADQGEMLNEQEVLGEIRVSSEARCLSYSYPVHRIGPNHIPSGPEQTFLVVYRKDDEIRFLETNQPTMRVMNLLASHRADDALLRVVSELKSPGAAIDQERVVANGTAQLVKFAELGILRKRL
ncbi:MAG: DUF2063 domain-containing protein [Pseudomonadales bacterium]|nr:DUF2063 domain-containing protein [Pseudomonadales bacterium]